jgi:hypothetical protein
MIHFTYKTTHENGKFYVGRHSTEDINDGYFGSGTWVRSIKDKSSLKREILEFFECEEQLKVAEKLLISEVIGTDNCMNFNDNAVGFASGDLNPGKRPEEKKRRSVRLTEQHANGTHVWRNTPNFSETEAGKAYHKDRNKNLTEKGLHNFQSEASKAKVIARNKENAANGVNPMFDPEVAKKVADNLRNKSLREGVVFLRSLSRNQKKEINLGLGWYQKSDEWINEKILQFKTLQLNKS